MSCSWAELDPDCRQRCSYRCHGCGLHHHAVEAGGIHFCPTPGCAMAGAAWFRSELQSYELLGNGNHTVDPTELVEVALVYPIEDERIGEARDRMVMWWAKEHDVARDNPTLELRLLALAEAQDG